MLGLVCMLDGKGMKKGSNSIHNLNISKLKEAAIFNLNYTKDCINYCIKNNFIFRVSSAIIPYPEYWNWSNDKDILDLFEEIKNLSKKIRLIIHPDQFVVLNSDSENVIQNSLKILKCQSKIAELAGIETLILHIGKMKASQKFKDTFTKLDDYTKSILALENCHYYKVDEVLKLCQEIGIPIVLDVHHARITKSQNYDIGAIKASWNKKKPLAHISSGKNSFADKSHAEYILEEECKDLIWLFKDFDVEVEAKKKEKSLVKLRAYLKRMSLEI